MTSKMISRQQEEAARLERNLVHSALGASDRESARNILFQVLGRLSAYLGYPECDALFISTALELSTLCFIQGQSFGELFPYLQAALAGAERQGDRRSQALIKLHLGRINYFGERRLEAIKSFSEGKALVEELGDEDILIQAGEFLGLYFHMQGLFKEAREHFSRAAASYEAETGKRLINPSAAMWLCYCEAYLGQFPRALGRLDYYRRIAKEKSDQNLATTLRSVLGIILLIIKKLREASFHLNIALQEANNTGNALAHYFSLAALATVNLYEGRPEKARDLLGQSLAVAFKAGLIRQYATPLILETVYEFQRLGLESLPEFTFQQEFIRVMNEPNLHLKGVVLRLKAMEAMSRAGDYEDMEEDLKASEEYLNRCGDPIQLGKTNLEMARLRLRQNHQEEARAMAQQAWENFSGYGEVFYPDDLRHLLAGHTCSLLPMTSGDLFLNRFMEIVEELLPTADLNQLLVQSVAAINKFLGAERGGLFWFRQRNRGREPILRAACNLTKQEVFSEGFQSNLSYIFQAFRENKPLMVRKKDAGPNEIKAILCLPFEIDGKPQGVVYHDNSYVNDCFDIFDTGQLRQMANRLNSYIARVWGYSRKLEETAFTGSENLIHLESSDGSEIVTQSPVMNKILVKADRMADSNGTVLILGETGVGKELMAQRLYKKSRFHEGPLVVVDMTTISENLVESELFGHEKGAFTGADRQKKGRLELAHKGTLFIDEVGEIPKGIQVKLLRALQERTLVRVGGTRTLACDFRLIAATNRDLATEVAAGRFREDLYYRLNVLPLILPPLRERSEDILLLSRHFLNRYAAKYGYHVYTLSPEQEAALLNYHWPGNVRELKNVIERAVILSTGRDLELDLPVMGKPRSMDLTDDSPTLDELQRRYIQQVLEKTEGRMSGPGGAATILGMKRSSFYNRMKKLGLR
ncbi:MAG: sigma-54-dependent Fis family transcriptional regulator [Deltaproteobacteria bacterium]|nr:sigma-54-dependent Fis family transcriptional regulator [Deltaproteobacteria bacterium]